MIFKKKNLITGRNIISILVLLIVIAFVVIFSSFSKEKKEKPSFLSEIFPNSTIQEKDDNHYLINATEYYATEIRIGANILYLVVENYKNEAEIYRFYSLSPKIKLLKEVGVSISPEDGIQVKYNFSKKDITNDGLEELFVKLQTTGSNNSSFEILRMEGNSLENIKLEGYPDNSVEFDTIEYKASRIYLTNHGSDSNTKTQYKLEGNTLVPIKSVRFGWNSDTENENDCQVAEINPTGGIVKILENKKNCSIWTDSFNEYFKS
ncbi:MAG TPA: hypothetical protein VGO63_00950 [Candidatus Paceibacterota bacterium]|jgi:hypothetical protein|nr:hypothetical protein [Candidatus Paceibacterota bacterium]